MSNAWDDMKTAKENEYFERKNREALSRLADKKTEAVRKSPVTGEPMEQVVMNGVVVDRCPSSGGIWLDAGELEQLIEQGQSAGGGWLDGFAKSLGIKGK
jgi:hypothetical protein